MACEWTVRERSDEKRSACGARKQKPSTIFDTEVITSVGDKKAKLTLHAANLIVPAWHQSSVNARTFSMPDSCNLSFLDDHGRQSERALPLNCAGAQGDKGQRMTMKTIKKKDVRVLDTQFIPVLLCLL